MIKEVWAVLELHSKVSFTLSRPETKCILCGEGGGVEGGAFIRRGRRRRNRRVCISYEEREEEE